MYTSTVVHNVVTGIELRVYGGTYIQWSESQRKRGSFRLRESHKHGATTAQKRGSMGSWKRGSIESKKSRSSESRAEVEHTAEEIYIDDTFVLWGQGKHCAMGQGQYCAMGPR